MLKVQQGRVRLVAGLLAATMFLQAGTAPVPANANDGIDNTTTAAINPAQAVAALPQGSATFRRTLDLVKAGKYADAYAAARGMDNPVERRTIQWASIYYGGPDIDYESIARFTADAPDYATAALYRTRLEQSLVKANAAGPDVIRLLGGAMPNTIPAQIALAVAYLQDGQKDRAARIARSIWVDNYLDQATEEQVKAKLGALLDRDAHWARAIHLMMNDRAAGVERLLPYLSSGQKSLAVARIAVSRKAKNAKALLDAVDPAYQSNPVFIYSRAQRARQADLYESALDWLNKAKGDLPDAAEWWYERRALIRELLANGNAKLAYKAADTYREGPEGRLVEACFHAGWIAASFLNDPKSAKAHFEKMRGLSTLPDSVSQANYWLARTLRQLGDNAGAKSALEAAAKYGTVYYGLLARAELGLKGAEIRGMPAWQHSQSIFDSREPVQAIRLLAANGQQAMALPLMRTFAGRLTDTGEMVLAARLAQSIGAHQVAISIAETAEMRGAPMDLFSFPKDGLPQNAALAAIDKAAVYAITRQESRFQVDAVSSAGARGLMQLMPGTAKETAAKVGVDYSANRLVTDGAYNALLGSTYLAAQLSKYNGSLVLAAAAYNAGAGNANKWIAAYGDPRSDRVDPVVWVELIPFQETRKYVQRVLGNYLVYRTRLGDDGMTIMDALRKIPG